MLVLPQPDGGAICVGQASHAWISGQVARAWAWPVDRPEEAALAAGQHDVGMAEHDLAPLFDEATGLPVPFTALPRPVSLALWRAAPAKVLSVSAYAALGVSLHGSGLRARDAAELDDVAAYVASQRELQDELGARCGAPAQERERLRALLRVWDGISLSLLLGWDLAPTPVAGPGGGDAVVALRPVDGGAVLDPWPLRGDALEVRCEGRRLSGPASSERELHEALAAAELVDLRFTLRRA